MGIEVLLELPAAMCAERGALLSGAQAETFEDWWQHSQWGAAELQRHDASSIIYLGLNGPAFSTALFSAAHAQLPITPLNYRLSDEEAAYVTDH